MNQHTDEQLWERLVHESGPLTYAGQFSDEALLAAMHEQRVLLIEVQHDGYGGGFVYMTLINDTAALLKLVKYGPSQLHSWKLLVFAHALHLSVAESQKLVGGWIADWQDWAEIPHIPQTGGYG